MIVNTPKIFTILACTLVFSGCIKTSPKEVNINKEEQQQEQELRGKYSFKSLLSQNKNISCTYKFVDQENKLETTGKTYISGKKMYQELSTVYLSQENKTIKSFMISDGDYVYTWSEDKKTSGMKIKIEEQKVEAEKVKTDVAGARESMDREYDLDCSPWKVDENVFVLPEGVIFNDLSEMMKNLPVVPSMPNFNNP